MPVPSPLYGAIAEGDYAVCSLHATESLRDSVLALAEHEQIIAVIPALTGDHRNVGVLDEPWCCGWLCLPQAT